MRHATSKEQNNSHGVESVVDIIVRHEKGMVRIEGIGVVGIDTSVQLRERHFAAYITTYPPHRILVVGIGQLECVSPTKEEPVARAA